VNNDLNFSNTLHKAFISNVFGKTLDFFDRDSTGALHFHCMEKRSSNTLLNILFAK